MPSHGRGAYRAAKAATKVLNEETARMDRAAAAWQARIAELEAELDFQRRWVADHYGILPPSRQDSVRLMRALDATDAIRAAATGDTP